MCKTLIMLSIRHMIGFKFLLASGSASMFYGGNAELEI